MKVVRSLLITAFASLLLACGGGGGSSGGPVGGLPVVTNGSMTLELLDPSGAKTNFISASGLVSARVILKNSSGEAVAFRKVSFAVDDQLVKISPATSILTDASGAAIVQVAAASLSAAGAGTLSAESVVGGEVLTRSVDFQLAAANLTLTDLSLGAGTIPAYGNRAISVVTRINGVPATNASVKVNFSASCGVVSPEVVTSDAGGIAATTYSASDAKCAGTNVTISATSVGASAAVSGVLAVDAIKATNLQYVSATPSLIYLAGSGATTQAQVRFRVVDSSGNPVQNQVVSLSLVNPDPAAGLSIGSIGNLVPVSETTDATGQVTVAVFSGDVPTAVKVRAQLPAPQEAIQTTSSDLTVASGRATQKSSSLALGRFSIDAFNIDGVESTVTFSVADRQGNPVPNGTEVNFVVESGVMIPPTCVISGGTSRCTSTFRSSGTRPADGRVSILAYLVGEEDFVDVDSNNKYNADGGDTFVDIGNAYRDDNEDGVYSVGEFSVPRSGSFPCPSGGIGRSNTCDGVWGLVEVRREAVLVLASSQANVLSSVVSEGMLTVLVSDMNGNSMATGTTFAASKVSGSSACSVAAQTTPSLVNNRYGPVHVQIGFENCIAGDRLRLLVTSTSGVQTAFNFTLP